jgi:ubiquinone/menaquinone biosynthesis C-methylase UbiE
MTTIVEANIIVHSAMASTYNTNEPHYRPENRAKVRNKLLQLKQPHMKTMVDIGCGTGFLIDLAKDLFESIDGVDITQAMLDLVDVSSGNIKLHNSTAEKLPFADNSFDFAGSYAFLHHLEDYSKVLAEAARVLKPGGLYYVDLEPNRLFWAAMTDLEARPANHQADYSAIVKREIDSVLHTDERVEGEFGISADVFNNAEYTKSILGGIDPYEFEKQALAAGFSKCNIRFDWYLGQGKVLHQQSAADAAVVENFLREVLPTSSHLFKYIEFVLVK